MTTLTTLTTVRPTPTLWAEVQYVDFMTKPGHATLWDEPGFGRFPIRLGMTEDGTVRLAPVVEGH